MSHPAQYDGLIVGIAKMLDIARHVSARAVNALMSAAYWDIGRRIVEFEQKGRERAGYGEELLGRLSFDLTKRFGRGFSPDNLELMRRFYLAYPPAKISETLSRKSSLLHGDQLEAPPLLKSADSKTPQVLPVVLSFGISDTSSRKFTLDALAACFPLPWSHYVLLVRRSRSPEAMEPVPVGAWR
jgi:hypothetical protein